MLLDQLLSFYLLSIAGDQTQGFTNIRLIPYQKEELPLPVLLFCHFTEKKNVTSNMSPCHFHCCPIRFVHL